VRGSAHDVRHARCDIQSQNPTTKERSPGPPPNRFNTKTYQQSRIADPRNRTVSTQKPAQTAVLAPVRRILHTHRNGIVTSRPIAGFEIHAPRFVLLAVLAVSTVIFSAADLHRHLSLVTALSLYTSSILLSVCTATV
jgi:hypothetical protein